MSHVVGKNREELLAMAKEQGDLKKAGEGTLKEDPTFPAKVMVKELRKDMSTARHLIDFDRSIGEKRPRTSGDDGPSLFNMSGYNPKRQEFEVEYDNDAEQLLADMEFKETDMEVGQELKLRVLRIYWRRLEERKRRKDFILERNLLHPDAFEKGLSPEEKELCQWYRPVMRFHSKEEHEELLKTVVEEHRILKRIQDLKDARAAGCLTSDEAERFISLKRKREAEEHVLSAKESLEAGAGGETALQRDEDTAIALPEHASNSVGGGDEGEPNEEIGCIQLVQG